MDEGDGALAFDSSPYGNNGMINDGGSGNPVSYWTFDEGSGQTAYDSIGSDNGTLGANSSEATDDPVWIFSGRVGGALEFDGSNDYVDYGGVDVSAAFTLEAWVLNKGDNYNNVIVGNYSGNGYSHRRYTLEFYGSNIAVGLANGSTNANKSSTDFTSTTLNKWHHVVGTYDGTDIELFLDGVSKGASTPGFSPSAGSYYKIGSSKDSYYFNGLIDDVKIYDYARDEEQIKRDYVESYKSKWVPGKVAGAMQFDGVDDYMETDYTTLPTAAFSMEFWFNNKADQPNYQHPLGIDGQYITFYIAPDGGTMYFKLGGAINSQTTIFDPNLDTWYHVATTFDGTDYRIYLDGNYVKTWNQSEQTLTNHILRLATANIGSNEFNGLLDEVRIYNRALSAEEIRFHYNRGGPVGYWKFDEGSGTLVGDITDNMNNAIIHGPYLSFDGGDHVEVTDNASLKPNQFSVESWFKISSATSWRVITAKEYWDNNKGWVLFIGSAGNGFVKFNGPQFSELVSTSEFDDGVWHHAVATYNADIVKLYVDGSLHDSASGVTITSSDLDLYVGARHPNDGSAGSSDRFVGAIDESRFYNRVLSAKEIEGHYRGLFKNETGLAMYLPLDENTGDTAYDYSINSNNGNLEGTCPGSATCPTWTPREGPTWTTGKFGNALDFNGTSDFIDPGDVYDGVKTISFWLKADDITERKIIDIDGTDYIEIDSNSDILATSFPGTTTIYIDGQDKTSSPTIDTNWHHIVITDTTGVNASAVNLGRKGSDYFDGKLDEVRFYGYVRTMDEIRLDYNAGFSARFGPHSSCDEDPGACMTNGLVGYWNFDEGSGQKAEDVSGEGNDGTLGSASSSDANDPKWTTGKKRGALDFDGVNDYVEVVDSASLDISNEVTIVVWVKFNDLSQFGAMVSKRTVWSTASGYHLAFDKITVDGIEMRGRRYNYARAHDAGLVEGIWYHIVGILNDDGSKNKVYINAVDSTVTTTASETIELNDLNVIIGSHSPPANYFNGTIDEVRIYNRSLSETEIRYHYNKGGPVAHWTFDEGNGLTAYDESDNSNDGTLKSSGLDFDGVNDYVDVGNNSSLKITDGDITIEAWVKPDSLAADNRVFANFVYMQNGYAMNIFSDGRFYLGTWQSSAQQSTISSVGAVTVGNWNHLVVTRTGATSKTYRNGVDVTTTSGSHIDPVSSTVNARIGNDNSNSWPFDGKIDEVRIYNTDLSAAEIARHYNNDFSQEPTANLVMLHHFEEGMACNANDEAGCLTDDDAEGVNDGTLKNFDTLTSWDNGTDGWVSEVKKPSWRWDTGKYGQAGSFNGWDDVISISNNSLDFGTGDFSWMGWVYIDDWYEWNDQNSLLTKGGSSASDDGWRTAIYNNGKIWTTISDGSSREQIATDTGLIQTRQWYHIAVTYDRDADCIIYIDGEDMKSQDITGSNGSVGSNALIIGRYTSGRYLNGKLDDVRIYDYARSEEEIRVDYNAGLAARFGPLSGCDEDPGSCMDKGLVGSWGFDEASGSTAYDSSENSNDGTLNNNPVWTTGKIKSGLEFDGVNDYVNLGDDTNLSITGDLTLMGWFSFAEWPVTAHRGLISKSYYGEYLWQVYYGGGSGRQMYLWQDQTVVFGYLIPEDDIVVNEFYHFVIVRDDTLKKIHLYINSIHADTDDYVVDADASGHYATIGSSSETHFQPFNGVIDDVRIYNRALSAEEIRYHYNKGGPVAYWDFDEGEGQTAYDYTDNDNDGTITQGSGGWVEGKYGSAYEFDGSTTYVDAGNDTSLDIVDAITVEAWAKWNGTPTDWDTIVAKGSQSNNDHMWVHFRSNGIELELGNESIRWAHRFVTTPVIGTWYHFAGTYDSVTEKSNVYLNGVAGTEIDRTGFGILGTNAYILTIGRASYTSNYYLNGVIDEVRVYNYARSPSQILQDYNQGAAVHFK